MTLSVPGPTTTGPTTTGPLSPPRPDFATTAPAANPVFYRTYSRKLPSGRESWNQVAERNLEGLRRLGHLNDEEVALLRRARIDLLVTRAVGGRVTQAKIAAARRLR